MPNNPDDDEATPTFEKVRLKPNFPSREIEKNFNKIRLREKLTPIEYQVTQEKHTERPFTNKYYKHKVRGTYVCKVCEEPIFNSATKFDSGSGWPSFYDVIDKESVVFKPDTSAIGANLLLIVKRPELIRTEVSCRNCGSHLGHIFKDGPKPTGQRYCINSCSLDFRPSNRDDASEENPIEHLATLGGCDGKFCFAKNTTTATNPKMTTATNPKMTTATHPKTTTTANLKTTTINTNPKTTTSTNLKTTNTNTTTNTNPKTTTTTNSKTTITTIAKMTTTSQSKANFFS